MESATTVVRKLSEVERECILQALKVLKNNRTHAARELGISIRTLRNKLNEYRRAGIEIEPSSAGAIPHSAVECSDFNYCTKCGRKTMHADFAEDVHNVCKGCAVA